MFTSSIASAQGWDLSKGAFPEEVEIDSSVAVGGGYGEGKYVAERVCFLLIATLGSSANLTAGPCKEWPSGNILPNWPNIRWNPEWSLVNIRLGPIYSQIKPETWRLT